MASPDDPASPTAYIEHADAVREPDGIESFGGNGFDE
jgi:hypothetical protein